MEIRDLNQTPPPHTHKILWSIIAVMLLVVVVGSVYWWKEIKQTAEIAPLLNEYADWKTYTNSQYGYEFKYPRDWTIDSELQPIIALENAMYDSSLGKGLYFTVLTPEQVAVGDKNVSEGLEVISTETVSINGYAWKKVLKKEKNSQSRSVTFSLTKDNLVFSLNYQQDQDKDKISNQILSTFKFTK